MNAYSLRISSIFTILMNSSFIIFHSAHYRTKPVVIDFVGTPTPTFMALLCLDIVVVHFQLIRGILLPLDSAEIVFSQPFFRYSTGNSDAFPIEEIDELIVIPRFNIDYLGFLFGILWGMNFNLSADPSRVIRDLRTSFRWRLMRLNAQLRRNRSQSPISRLPV
jgi:hypothetical protein